MASLGDVAWHTEVTTKRKSFMIPVMGSYVDVEAEFRSEEPVVVNAVLADGNYVFLGRGEVLRVKERLRNVSALELVASKQVAYRCLMGVVQEDEIIDPTPAVVHEAIGDDDHIAYAVKIEVEKYLRALGKGGYFSEEIDPDELVDDILNGDLEFDEEDDDDGFVSRSYEDMAVPLESQATSQGVEGAGNEAPSSSLDPQPDVEEAKA